MPAPETVSFFFLKPAKLCLHSFLQTTEQKTCGISLIDLDLAALQRIEILFRVLQKNVALSADEL